MLVYFAPERTFHKLSSEQDLDQLLQGCDGTVMANAKAKIQSKLQSTGQLAFHHEK